VEQANQIVIDEILKLQFDDNYLKEIAKGNADEISVDDKRLVIEKRIDEISTQLDRIMDMYQLGAVPLDKIAERIEILNNERNGLESELFALSEETESKKMPIAETRDILKKAKTIFDGDDKDAKRMLIHSLIERVELYEDKVKIYWAF
jgi:site-specific DNA recombinase